MKREGYAVYSEVMFCQTQIQSLAARWGSWRAGMDTSSSDGGLEKLDFHRFSNRPRLFVVLPDLRTQTQNFTGGCD